MDRFIPEHEVVVLPKSITSWIYQRRELTGEIDLYNENIKNLFISTLLLKWMSNAI